MVLSVSNDQSVKQTSFYSVCRRSAVPLAALAVIGLAGFGLRRAGVLSRVDYLNGGLVLAGALVVGRNVWVSKDESGSTSNSSRRAGSGAAGAANLDTSPKGVVGWLDAVRLGQVAASEDRARLIEQWAADCPFSEEQIWGAVEEALKKPDGYLDVWTTFTDLHFSPYDLPTIQTDEQYGDFLVAKGMLTAFQDDLVALECRDVERIASALGWNGADMDRLERAKAMFSGSYYEYDSIAARQARIDRLRPLLEPRRDELLSKQVELDALAEELSSSDLMLVRQEEISSIVREMVEEVEKTIPYVVRYEYDHELVWSDQLYQEWKERTGSTLSEAAFCEVLKGCSTSRGYWGWKDRYLVDCDLRDLNWRSAPHCVSMNHLKQIRTVLRNLNPWHVAGLVRDQRGMNQILYLTGLGIEVTNPSFIEVMEEALRKGGPDPRLSPPKEWREERDRMIDAAIESALGKHHVDEERVDGLRALLGDYFWVRSALLDAIEKANKDQPAEKQKGRDFYFQEIEARIALKLKELGAEMAVAGSSSGLSQEQVNAQLGEKDWYSFGTQPVQQEDLDRALELINEQPENFDFYRLNPKHEDLDERDQAAYTLLSHSCEL